MKNNKTIIVFTFLTLFLLQCGFVLSCDSENGKITADDARQILTEKILSNKLDGKIIYTLKTPLEKGETIRAMAKTYQADAFASSWVFFIDDAPQANWEHPCRYAFIDESTGKYMVVEAGSPPDDMNLFMKLHPQP